MRCWLIPIVLWSLTGCNTVNSSPIAGPSIPLKSYPQPFQTQLAAELQSAAADSATAIAVTDYGQLRRAVCAARGWKGGPCPAMQAAAQ